MHQPLVLQMMLFVFVGLTLDDCRGIDLLFSCRLLSTVWDFRRLEIMVFLPGLHGLSPFRKKRRFIEEKLRAEGSGLVGRLVMEVIRN